MAAGHHPSLVPLLGFALLSSGCHSWQVQSVPAAELLAASSPPAEIRLKLLDSTQLVLREPRLTGDSVAGMMRGTRAAVPVADVAQVAVRRFSPGRTVGLVAASVASLFGVAAAVCAAESCGAGVWDAD